MLKINPYLNFDGNAEEAFAFYKSVFGGEFYGPVQRMDSLAGTEHLPEDEKNRILHVSLPIGENCMLMASDIAPSMGHPFSQGTNFYITLNTDTKEEADRLYTALSTGGTVEMELQNTFWGAYFGSFRDKFGVQWMVSYENKAA